MDMDEGDTAADPSWRAALQAIQRDINCLTHEDRAVRRSAITKLHKHLLAAACDADSQLAPTRRLRVPKNPVALRAQASLQSQPRPFTLKAGDVVEVLEAVMVGERERVHFKKNGVDCWASVRAGDGGVLLEEAPPVESATVCGVEPTPGMLAYLVVKCQQPLTRLLSDPVEKCRELSAETIAAVVKALGELAEGGAGGAGAGAMTALFDSCLRVMSRRLGQKEVEEPAEEIRLWLVKLLRAFVDSPGLGAEEGGALAESLGTVCTVLGKMAADPFPDMKKECALLTLSLVARLPERIAHHAPPLAKILLANTGHQHSRVRVATVQALGQLVQHGADACYDDLAPQFLVLTRDRASSVREAMAQAVAAWAVLYCRQATLAPSLLRLLIAGAADESVEVSMLARDGFDAASRAFLEAPTQDESAAASTQAAAAAAVAAQIMAE
eukprot:COSAG01_NODE_14349_length_1465_cov_2.313939_1_plen_441_part_10